MKKLLLSISCLAILCVASIMTSCQKSLNIDELQIIENEISKKVFADILETKANALDDYLWKSIEANANEQRNIINDIVSSGCSWGTGTGLDLADLIFSGKSIPQLLNEKYNQYITFVNRHREPMYELIMNICQIMETHPELKQEYKQCEQDSSSMSLSLFSSISNLPANLDSNLIVKYQDIKFNEDNYILWGRIMGYYAKPSFSKVTVLIAMMKILQMVDTHPYPVYAIYNKDEKGWEIGYNSEVAMLVHFKRNGDIIHSDFDYIQYNGSYVNSKSNRLHK